MALQTPIIHARGTRASFNALKAASGLREGQLYFLTDEDRFVYATGVDASLDVPLMSEVGGGGGSLPTFGGDQVFSADGTRYMSTIATGANLSTTVLAAGTIFAIPIFIGRSWSPNRIAIRSGAYTSAGNVRLGIYADASGQPGARVLDAGAVNVTGTNTTYQITISTTLTPGLYWLVMVRDTATFNIIAFNSVEQTMMLGRTTAGSAIRCLTRTFAYGALPSNESSQTYTADTTVLAPWISLRIA